MPDKTLRRGKVMHLSKRTILRLGGHALLLCAFSTVSRAAAAQSVPVVTGDARVDKLLSQMTLEEKLTLIHGTQEDPKVYQGQAGYLAGSSAARYSGIALCRWAAGRADAASLAG